MRLVRLVAVASVAAATLAGGCLDFPAAPAPIDAATDAAEAACPPTTSGPRCVAADLRCVDYGGGDPGSPCAVCGPDGAMVSCPFGCLEGVCAVAVGVSAGEDHACATTDGGEVWCWGSRAFGAVGDGVVALDEVGPRRVPLAAAVAEVRVGRFHSCARAAGGEVWCWGANSLRQCGAEVGGVVAEPYRVPLPEPAVALAPMDGVTSCARVTDGRLLCWGFVVDGQEYSGPQSGRGEASPREAPVVAERADAFAIATTYGCAVEGDAVRCWGRSSTGADEGPAPWALPDIDGARVSLLSLSFDSACLVIDGGDVRCWGFDTAGELGADSPGFVPTPRPLDPGVGALLIAIGSAVHHTCAVTASGEVWCWGGRLRGQSGPAGFAVPGHLPVEVPMVAPVTGLAVGRSFSCALDVGGFVWCWGDNESGQLGGGESAPPYTSIPQRVGR